ncbi:MAG: hypothetical protein JNK45_26835 [Myxococcales bacterium]|nr:hypothetical protein [Myxococcales bacterium]
MKQPKTSTPTTSPNDAEPRLTLDADALRALDEVELSAVQGGGPIGFPPAAAMQRGPIGFPPA